MQTGPYDLIALGETMVALAALPGTSLRDGRRPGPSTMPAPRAENACVGLARWASATAWISRLGADAAR